MTTSLILNSGNKNKNGVNYTFNLEQNTEYEFIYDLISENTQNISVTNSLNENQKISGNKYKFYNSKLGSINFYLLFNNGNYKDSVIINRFSLYKVTNQKEINPKISFINGAFIHDNITKIKVIIILKKNKNIIELINKLHNKYYVNSISNLEFINGFTCEILKSSIKQILLDYDEIEYIEPDYKFKIPDYNKSIINTRTINDTIPWYIERVGSLNNSVIRPNKKKDPINISNTNNCDIFILDTGCNNKDNEINIVENVDFTNSPNGAIDIDGHGTSVAFIAGSKINSNGIVGIAPNVRIHGYKVLGDDGSGDISNILRAIDAVVTWKRNNLPKKNNKIIINMSLGTVLDFNNDFINSISISNSFNTVINNAIANNISVVVAAGNDNTDANIFSPANILNAVTCAASTKENQKAYFSNWGNIVDIYAPGQEINSYDITTNSYSLMNGTSFSSPIITGLLALVLIKYPTYTPSQAFSFLRLMSIKGQNTKVKNKIVNPPIVNPLGYIGSKTTNLCAYVGNW